MAQVAIRCLITRQYVGESSNGRVPNASIDVLDLDTRQTFRFTLRGAQIDGKIVDEMAPCQLILHGVELRAGDRGSYLTATSIDIQPVNAVSKQPKGA